MQQREYDKAIELGINYLREEKYEEAILAFNAAKNIDDKKQEAYDYTEVGNTERDIKLHMKMVIILRL